MNLIQIYVSEVIKYLPRQLKDEVKKELTSLIMDMIEESEGDEKAIQSILENMGSPKDLADRYLNKEKSLIGPRYYDTYIMIVKIVMFALALAFTITFAMKLIFSQEITGWTILEYPLSLFNAAIMGFAYVTIIFALIERNQVKIEDEDLVAKSWSVKDLPKESVELPTHRLENIFEIGFVSILMFIINFQPQIIGIYSSLTSGSQTSWTVTPLLNDVTRSVWIIWINVWLIFMLVSGVIKSIYRLDAKHRILLSTFFDFLALIMFVFIMATQKIFVDNIAGLIAPGNEAFELLVNRGSFTLLVVILTLSMFDILRKLIKVLKQST
jgi:hypothetical protein